VGCAGTCERFGFKASTLEAIENFVLMIRSSQSMMAKHNAYEIAFHIGKQTSFVKELFNDKSAEGVARYDNIQELLNSIKEWIETPLNEEDGEVDDKGLGAYLQQNYFAHRRRPERSKCRCGKAYDGACCKRSGVSMRVCGRFGRNTFSKRA
jgi:arginine/lysine/ornithine decarboxylase